MLSAPFLDFINKERLFEKDEYLLLAISGGLDSVVLAHLLKHNGYNFALAHMNFQLRGEDSNIDEQFLEDLAKKLKVKIFTKRVEVPKNQGSTQIQARELRYTWFKELMKKHSFSKLLTAHHANDLLETALLNLSRGTGIKGVRSILPLQNNIARPLLFAGKEELEQFARGNSIEWREDVSNASDHYTRNKIRHHVIPQLMAINPNLIASFQQTALRLRATEEAWNEKLDSITKQYFRFLEEHIEIDKLIFKNPHSLIYLSELLSDYGFGLAQLQSFDFNRVGAQLLGSEYILSVDRDILFVTKTKDGNLLTFFPKLINLEEDSIKTPFGFLKWNFVDYYEVNFNQDAKVAYVDYELLKAPLEIDIWHEGDKIQPIGMRGKKKISDILIDQKVPLYRKEQIMVLKSNEEIVWVVGYKFSDVFKIKKKSHKILRIAYYENTKSI
jgi:tRNA(Ile)-lysidine synthase